MKLFIDSGNLKDIQALVPLGIIDGVTTNPSLMAKEGGDPRAITKEICRLVKPGIPDALYRDAGETRIRADANPPVRSAVICKPRAYDAMEQHQQGENRQQQRGASLRGELQVLVVRVIEEHLLVGPLVDEHGVRERASPGS